MNTRPLTRHSVRFLWCAVTLAGACVPPSVADKTEQQDSVTPVQQAAKDPPLDVDKFSQRVLAITDKTILARFPFERVMGQLAGDTGQSETKRVALFQQWWDIFNPKPGLVNAGQHCDDTVDPTLGPVINKFPFTCRAAPSEGALATVNPYDPKTTATDWPAPYAANANSNGFIPIGLFNRFDLMPEDGGNCGEYRIVYAKRTGQTDTRNRLLIIFEAKLRNPTPQQGTKTCRQVAQMWRNLYDINDSAKRASILERFYFNGTISGPDGDDQGAGFGPVVDVSSYASGSNSGQIRTNQFMSPVNSGRSWSLREFKLTKACDTCAVKAEAITVKTNPYGPLFRVATDTDPLKSTKAAFGSHLVSQVESLAANDVNGFAWTVPDELFNSPQSEESSSDENRYLSQFTGTGLTLEPAGADNTALRASIQAQLNTLVGKPGYVTLTPDNIVARAQALSCAGCHRLNNATPEMSLGGSVTWPVSLGFTHVTENGFEDPGTNQRFKLSPALKNVFLPFRGQKLRDFLDGKEWKTNKHAVH